MDFRVLRSNFAGPLRIPISPYRKNIGFYEPRFLRTSGFTNFGIYEHFFRSPWVFIYYNYLGFYELFLKTRFCKKVKNQISVIIDKVIIKKQKEFK